LEPGWSSKPLDPERRHGRGIGMALVQQVVSRHGGTIEIVNTAAAEGNDTEGLGGAYVTVHLPSIHEADSY
jgi:two-component system CitB family sensor kinase